jgi:hypothetical protein
VSDPDASSADRARTPGAVDVVGLWPLSRRSAGERAAAFLVALDGAAALRYPLGTRNKRLLDAHESLVRRPLEAHVACPGCGTDNEFGLPARAVAELPSAPPDAAAHLRVDGVRHAFRLPVLADLTAADGRPAPTGLADLAVRTCLGPPAPRLGPDDLELLAEAWEALDPAGSLRVDLSCAGCGRAIAADADPADFVARDLDLLVDRLMHEVDVIAGTYGWSEAAILALPSERRLRYVEIVTGSPVLRRPAAVR